MEELKYDNELLPKENWFKRNWKWVVPIGCLSFFILFIVLMVGGFIYGFTKITSDSEVTKHAISIINHNPEVKNKLGDNIKTDGVFRGNISMMNNRGNADIEVPIKGDKGKGTAIIVADKESDKWNYERIAVKFDDSGVVIEIQKVK